MKAIAAVLVLLVAQVAAAQDAARKPQDYRSRHFLLHTDLPEQQVQEQLRRLETMLSLISTYWGRAPRGQIECYVVDDPANWPAGSLNPAGLAKILQGAGVTISQKLSVGDKFISKAVVYAVAEHGVVQHEAVHAYCQQTFGRTGPVWYAEGMAEMGNYWREGEKSVLVDPRIIDYLKTSEPKSIADVVSPEQFTGDSWQNYAWRWALCHLLANNTNYAARFRPLGLAILTDQPVSFEQVYGAMAREISFEYLFFLAHLESGLRADLCSWDWKRRFRPLTTSRGAISARIVADRGWQPSGLTVAAGTEYQYTTSGRWQTSAEMEPADPGNEACRLAGIVMTDYQLGEPIQLGASGTFTAVESGDLYLRCRDKWNELADNKGRVTVKLSVKQASAR